MGCIKQATKGGSSIISSAKKIYEYLKKNNPKMLNILRKNFILKEEDLILRIIIFLKINF